jgi:hypothetical protein
MDYFPSRDRKGKELGQGLQSGRGEPHGLLRQKNNKVVWTGVGLNEQAASELQSKVKRDLAS